MRIKWYKVLIHVLFYMEAQKITISCGFNLISNSWQNGRWQPRRRPLLVTSQPSVAPPPVKYTSSCWEGQRLSAKSKIVSKYCNISKNVEKGSISSTRGINFRVRPRVNMMHCTEIKIENRKSTARKERTILISGWQKSIKT